LLLILAAALLLAALPASAQKAPDYVIGPQDVLAVTVWDQENLSGKFTVETDGSFNYPLVGRVQAAGLTLRDFEAALKKRLAEFLKNPQVSVAVQDYRSQRIFVTGEVHTPGTYPLTGDMTLIEALARAGSTTAFASRNAVVVRPPKGRAADGPADPARATASEVIRVDLRRLQEGTLAENMFLRDGDTVYVPPAETIYVFGQVRTPGTYPLRDQDMTVMQALALAGGITDRGAKNRIKITRLVNGKSKDINVKLTDIVKPGDTIVVPERYF
jgi:polysaccharide export outer membrane protein